MLSPETRADMRRREFITLVGGAVTWPVVARAQQPTMPVIGFLRSTRADGFAHLLAAFRAGLNEVGYVEGRNVAIEYRWAEDHKDRLSAMATELVRRPVAVIVGNSVAALAAKAATTTVPIVFATGSDPVRDGLVGSLNRPSGNVTGIVFFSGTLGAKRLELLHQLVPKATSVALLLNPTTTEAEAERRDVQAATNATGQQLIILMSSTTATSRQLLQHFSNEGPVHCLSVPALSLIPIGNESWRWRPAMGCRTAILRASSPPPVD
jgi:putative ABC transport system substrate-binding protein